MAGRYACGGEALQLYNIAGLVFGVDSQLPQADDGVWQKFSCEGTPQLLYRVRYAPCLPSPGGEALHADARVRCYQTAQGLERIYSDIYTHRDTVHFAESRHDGQILCELTVAQDRYPWGATAAQLYEVLSLPHYLLEFGRLLMHGAYVLHEGRAIIFTAPSGVGKSTQAELWRRCCGAQVINGDRTLLGFDDGRLMAYGYPFSGSSDDCENVTSPVAAIVLLSQAKENRLERLSAVQAIGQLAESVYLQPEHRPDLSAQLDFSVKLMQHVPVFRLACLPDESAVKILRENL